MKRVLTNFIQKRTLLFYVVLNYLISWGFLYPGYQAILNAEEGTFPLFALIALPGGFGPTIAAIITVWITEGKEAVLQLLKKYKTFRVHYKWYILVLILPIILYLFSLMATTFMGFELGRFNYNEGIKMILPYMLIALPFGPIMEELGWRGYMLPELLKKYNIYTSSLILGITWTFWHLASFSFPGAAIPSVFEVSIWTISLYLLSIIAQTFVFSYFYIQTKGSLIIAILLHTSFNASSNIVLTFFPDTEGHVDQQLYLYVINILLIALTAFMLFKQLKSTQQEV
ncbi:MAG: CPBP family intramembrane metalloprotease [Chitinophagales bacterium]|nr:CPBP family intramembrane metalloprotease [Chitinophagales bacterium]